MRLADVSNFLCLALFVFGISFVFGALTCIFILFRLIIVWVFIFKLVFSKSVVVVRLWLLAGSVYVNVDSIDCLRSTVWVVMDLRKLPVELQKLLLTDQSAVRTLTFRIVGNLQLLNELFLLSAFRQQHFVLLLESLVRSYLVSDQVTFHFLGGVLDKPVKALPGGISIPFPRYFELDKVLILLFTGNSVPFNPVNSVPAVLLAPFRWILLRYIFLLVRDVLSETFCCLSLSDGPVILVRFTLFVGLHRVYLDRLLPFFVNILALSVRRLKNCLRTCAIAFCRP